MQINRQPTQATDQLLTELLTKRDHHTRIRVKRLDLFDHRWIVDIIKFEYRHPRPLRPRRDRRRHRLTTTTRRPIGLAQDHRHLMTPTQILKRWQAKLTRPQKNQSHRFV